MFINAESFLNEENLQKMENFCDNDNNNVQRLCHYIQGSVHQNFIDVPFVLKVINTLVIYTNAIMFDFFSRVLN